MCIQVCYLLQVCYQQPNKPGQNLACENGPQLPIKHFYVYSLTLDILPTAKSAWTEKGKRKWPKFILTSCFFELQNQVVIKSGKWQPHLNTTTALLTW